MKLNKILYNLALNLVSLVCASGVMAVLAVVLFICYTLAVGGL